jgi:hypothetical protein
MPGENAFDLLASLDAAPVVILPGGKEIEMSRRAAQRFRAR